MAFQLGNRMGVTAAGPRLTQSASWLGALTQASLLPPPLGREPKELNFAKQNLKIAYRVVITLSRKMSISLIKLKTRLTEMVIKTETPGDFSQGHDGKAHRINKT